jgi:hypothetical protein
LSSPIPGSNGAGPGKLVAAATIFFALATTASTPSVRGLRPRAELGASERDRRRDGPVAEGAL